ncbi:MAG: hypothetical protein HN576_10410 [Bacteriovoracaceae bacterium]|jgi:hypothetical protein|nr:hypothetical protein [Bacteriovoracaceae bacterium]
MFNELKKSIILTSIFTLLTGHSIVFADSKNFVINVPNNKSISQKNNITKVAEKRRSNIRHQYNTLKTIKQRNAQKKLARVIKKERIKALAEKRIAKMIAEKRLNVRKAKTKLLKKEVQKHRTRSIASAKEEEEKIKEESNEESAY